MTNAAANIIPAEWKSISLEAMNEKAAMQTRVDRKYIVSTQKPPPRYSPRSTQTLP